MKTTPKSILYVSAITILTVIVSCEVVQDQSSGVSESLDPIEEVVAIEGAEQSTLIVNKSNASYFSLEFQDIQPNNVITNGISEGWCIDWETPINSEDGRYENIQLYSTNRVEQWKPLNYLLNIKDDLMQNDPEMSWQEIQLIIWSLRGIPEFDLSAIPIEDLPSRMTTDGEPNFRYEKVYEILELIENNHQNFSYEEGSKYAVIAETPADVQTVITVVE